MWGGGGGVPVRKEKRRCDARRRRNVNNKGKKQKGGGRLLPPGSVDSGPSYWPPRVPRTSGSPIQSQATPPTPNQCPPKIQPKQPIGGRGALASLKPQNSLPAMDPARWQDHISDGNSIYAIIISSVPASAPDSAHGRRNLGGAAGHPPRRSWRGAMGQALPRFRLSVGGTGTPART